MMKKNLLYMMHVPWEWIKQRPHFIAEYISDYFNLTVSYRRPFKRKGLVKNITKINLRKLKTFPFNRYKLIRNINNFILKKEFEKLVEENEYIWVTHPNLYRFIEMTLKDRNIVIYDCMDDILEFPNLSDSIRSELFKLEKRLVLRADVVFVSSLNLKRVLLERYKFDLSKMHVINNAIDSSILKKEKLPLPSKLCNMLNELKKTKLKKIAYIGTVDEWIDFDLIKHSLEKRKDIEYIFIGPVSTKVPSNNRIKFLGPIEHEFLPQISKIADIFIMPFKLNKLILSVDPVKIYEYIYFCKPIISVKYGETMKFSDYVVLYEDKEDYINKLSDIIENNITVDCAKNIDFLNKNTWSNRVNEIVEILSRVNSK